MTCTRCHKEYTGWDFIYDLDHRQTAVCKDCHDEWLALIQRHQAEVKAFWASLSDKG